MTKRDGPRARKIKDPEYYHGHHVVSGDQLRQVFPEDPEELENPVRFRHQILHGIVLVLLAAILVTATIVAFAVARGELKLPFLERPEAATPTPSCPAGTFSYLPNNDVRVNVYNATAKEGLATSVAAELKARGYKVGEVANKATNYVGAAVVVSGPGGQAAAFNLQHNVPNSEYVEDGRTDSTVDLVLSPGYSTLVKPELVDQTPGKLSCPRFSPSPSAAATAATGAAKK